MMKRLFRLVLILVAVVSIVLGYYFLWIFDAVIAPMYDEITEQTTVRDIKKVQSTLDSFETCTFQELPNEWQKRFSSENIKVCAKLRNDKFYKDNIILKINYLDRYKFIVGKLRIKDFLAKDRLIKQNIRNPYTNEIVIKENSYSIPHLDKIQYLILSKKLLFKIHELQEALRKRKLNPNAFRVVSGFRPPFYNHLVGGKSCSRHQFGDAVDIHFGDVNSDGKINQKDKKIFYNTLQKVIGRQGGLGVYKSSFRTIHFDTRGHQARWHY